MEAKLFSDLTKVLKDTTVGSPLSKVVLKHANRVQTAKLAKDFNGLYSVSKAGKVSARRKPKVTAEVKDEPISGVRKSISITLGGYGHKAGALESAQQFLHPNVFQYQSALFPDPRTHNVQAKVARAEPIELDNNNPLYPWGIKLVLTVEGVEQKVNTWITQFTNQIRLHSTES